MLKVGSKWISKQVPQSFRNSYPSVDAVSQYDSTALFNYPKIALYDSTNIDALIWPTTEDGEYAKKFLLPLIKEGVHHYIDNIHTEIKILKVGELILPITINDAQYENSYVCSPYCYYVKYAIASEGSIKNHLLKGLFKGVFWGLSKLFRFLEINKVVIVNNWLLSTNLIPKMNPKHIPLITQFLKEYFPNHAITFRSIDAQTNANHFQALKDNSYKLIAARQIYLTDTNQKNVFESRLFKSDLKLLQTSGYEVVDSNELTSKDIARVLELYQDVYFNKFAYPPRLNQNYVQLALDHQILTLKALKKDGNIDGIAGYFCRNGILTCPLFGYDKTKIHTGIYRILSTLLMLEAKKNQMVFHQSAGASMYKKIRKATDCLEYTAVYDKHLTIQRKIPWLLIRSIFNTIGVYFMKKY